MSAWMQEGRTYRPYICDRCGMELGPSDPYAIYEVVGWERNRAQGGTNHLSGRARTGRAICAECQSHPEEHPSLFM